MAEQEAASGKFLELTSFKHPGNVTSFPTHLRQAAEFLRTGDDVGERDPVRIRWGTPDSIGPSYLC